jgi:CRP/FNR family transcriptional regulator, cyclic AMP receptor protein
VREYSPSCRDSDGIIFASSALAKRCGGEPWVAMAQKSHGRSSVDHVALLSRHAVFGALTRPQLERLCSYAATRAVAAGTTLFAKGDPGDALYAVCAGTVKITVPSIDGREAMFNLLHAGEIFGEIALLDGQPRTADAVTMTDCELMVIERRDFMAFVHSEPKVALKLIELLCARLRWASEHFEEVVFLNLPTRLARTLLRLEETDDAAAEQQKVAITQQQLSLMLGVTRESINKQLSAWGKRKWIRLERGGIVVLARDSLQALASRQET